MNFFQAQQRARRNTGLLVLMFGIAVCGLILLTNLLLLVVYSEFRSATPDVASQLLDSGYSWNEFIVVSIGVCVLIFGGSLYKIISLGSGGAAVAEMLGGRLVPQATEDYQQRQLLNVVEEMSIAAGMPIPKVYLLEDLSINAFAAGNAPANAVIGVTQGTVNRLSREELQGVIAHEFSHIANGDMRLNIRLMGILHGIMLLSLIGYFILRSTPRSRSSRGNSGAIMGLGLGLMVIGYTGSFFGQWIKAIVSRQREYLADSSAVQFTRNKDGIAGALKKIGGGVGSGSWINSPSVSEYSHAYIANGVASFWQSMFSTHPPLEERIRKLDPTWDGQFLTSTAKVAKVNEEVKEEAAHVENITKAVAVLTSAEMAIAQVGTLNEQNIELAHELILAIPVMLRQASHDPYSARAVIYAMLINLQKQRDQALESFEMLVEPGMHQLAEKYSETTATLDQKLKLPLMELCINALRELSPNQFVQFKTAFDKIMRSDNSIKLNEWMMHRFIVQQLDLHFGFRKPAKAKVSRLSDIYSEATCLLSMMAHIEHRNSDEANKAFQSGLKAANLSTTEIVAIRELNLDVLNQSLDRLMELKPLAKPVFLKACLAIVLEDGTATDKGTELMRTISSCIDCPMPPLLH